MTISNTLASFIPNHCQDIDMPIENIHSFESPNHYRYSTTDTDDMDPVDLAMDNYRSINEKHTCDDSKCVSKGLSNGSFTCHGDDGTHFPMMCADGYNVVLTEDEPMNVMTPDGKSVLMHSFSCCPPARLGESYVTDSDKYSCSEPIKVYEDSDFVTVCDNQEIPRLTEPAVEMSTGLSGMIPRATYSVRCCEPDPDEDLGHFADDDSENFLDEWGCVPYHNQFYDASPARNRFGLLSPISCDIPDGNFNIPTPIRKNSTFEYDVASTGLYQCCKSGEALPPFIEDTAFKTTVYPLLALNCIAAMMSIVIGVGLLIPLLIQLKNGTFQRAMLSRNHRNSRIKGGEAVYSTYNLYLVYLALFDFIYMMFEIVVNSGYINQNFDPYMYSWVVSPSNVAYGTITPLTPIGNSYGLANILLNALIAHEVLSLLRRSKNSQKTDPPSLKKVNLQAAVVLFMAIMQCIILFFVRKHIQNIVNNGDFEKLPGLDVAFALLSSLFTVPTLAYIFYVAVVIWWRGYIPSTNRASRRDRSMRELALYFIRIVAIFVVIYQPVVFLFAYSMKTNKPWLMVWTNYLTALQPILTSALILTKGDTKKYIIDLLTLKYVFGKKDSRDTSYKDTSSKFFSPTCHTSANRSCVFVMEAVEEDVESNESSDGSNDSDDITTNDTANISGIDTSCITGDTSADVSCTSKTEDFTDDPMDDSRKSRAVIVLDTGEAVPVDTKMAAPSEEPSQEKVSN